MSTEKQRTQAEYPLVADVQASDSESDNWQRDVKIRGANHHNLCAAEQENGSTVVIQSCGSPSALHGRFSGCRAPILVYLRYQSSHSSIGEIIFASVSLNLRLFH